MQGGRKVVQFGQVRLGQLGYQLISLPGQLHPDYARVGSIGPAAHEASGLRTVHELHHAVMAEQQVAGELADSGRDLGRMTLDSNQQLVLDMGQADRAGLVFAPSLKAAQADAEGEEVLEILAGWLGQRCLSDRELRGRRMRPGLMLRTAGVAGQHDRHDGRHRATLGGRGGRRTRSTVSAGRESMLIVPPCRSTTMRWAMSRPSPVPFPTSLVV